MADELRGKATSIEMVVGDNIFKTSVVLPKMKKDKLFDRGSVKNRSSEGKPVVQISSTMVGDKRVFFLSAEKIWVDEDGKIVPSGEVTQWLEDPDTGKEQQVEKYDSTVKSDSTMQISQTIPRDFAQSFIPSDIYEVFAPDESEQWKLYKIAKELWDKGEVGIIKTVVLQSGFNPYTGLIIPYFDKDTFHVEVMLTTTKKEYKAGMKVPSGPPTVTTTIKKDDAKSKATKSLF